jgi:hypothetical protein
MGVTGTHRCEDCGKQFYLQTQFEEHAEECTGEGGPVFDGQCPMCGERYDEYTQHLTECGVREEHEQKTASSGAKEWEKRASD